MPISRKELEGGRRDNVCGHALGVIKLYVNINYVLHFKICQPNSLGCVKPHTSMLQSTRDLPFSGPCGRETKSKLVCLNCYFPLETMRSSEKINILGQSQRYPYGSNQETLTGKIIYKISPRRFIFSTEPFHKTGNHSYLRPISFPEDIKSLQIIRVTYILLQI